MFAVVDGVLLAPLDYRDADQLVAVAETKQGQDPVNMGYLSFVDLKRQARSVSHLVAATQSTATFSGGGQDAERVNAMRGLARLLRHGRCAAERSAGRSPTPRTCRARRGGW